MYLSIYLSIYLLLFIIIPWKQKDVRATPLIAEAEHTYMYICIYLPMYLSIYPSIYLSIYRSSSDYYTLETTERARHAVGCSRRLGLTLSYNNSYNSES